MNFSRPVSSIVFFVSLVSLIRAGEMPTLESRDKEQVHLFLLAGQSNMSGRGRVEPADKKIHPRVFALSKDSRWVPAAAPIHYDKKRAGVGLGKSFAIQLVEENPNIVIGLIPAACGGSSISSWAPGRYHSPTRSYPFDDAMQRIRRAEQDGTLKGILWHQGESDSNPEAVVTYAQNLRNLVLRFREDLNAANVPFIIGQLGQFAGNPWDDSKKRLNEAHLLISHEIPLVGYVSSNGLTGRDKLHFDSASLREFGRRYASVYLKLIEQDMDQHSEKSEADKTFSN
ncbi:MAG: sialate O-acetylesterase [Verrucomicrobiota bacterium]